MPITLGILAQARQAVGPTFELLESTVLGSAQASVEFTNLVTKYAATYQHLQIRTVVRTARNSTVDSLRMQVNGVTSTSYRSHYLRGFNSSLGSFDDGASSGMFLYDVSGNTDVSGGFAPAVIDLLDPFEGTKNLTVRALGGWLGSAERDVIFSSGLFTSTTAISSIKLYSQAGSNLSQFSRFSLYGIKATA